MKSVYIKTFGDVKQIKIDSHLIRSLLWHPEKRPYKTQVSCSIYEAPTNFLEKCQWTTNFQNALDKHVKKVHNAKIDILERSQPTSIKQLQNQMFSLWMINQQIKEYQKLKGVEGKVNQLAFNIYKFLFKEYYKPFVWKFEYFL